MPSGLVTDRCKWRSYTKWESGQIIELTVELPQSRGDEVRITQAKKEETIYKDIEVMEKFVTFVKLLPLICEIKGNSVF